MVAYGKTARHPKQSLGNYKNAGWNGLADWLGKKKRPVFLPYEEAKKVVNALGLKNEDDWFDGRVRKDRQKSKQSYIPAAGWNGFGDWLGPPSNIFAL